MALATVLAAVSSSVPALAQPATEAERERFAELLDETGGPVNQTAYTRAWGWVDSLATARLNAGTAPGALGGVLATLPGYSPASEGEGYSTGTATFYSALPREAPNYFATPLVVGRDTLVLGIYSLTINTPGRLSVYARRQGRWQRAGGLDASTPVSARRLFPGDTAAMLVAFDDFVGADRSESRTRVLRVSRTGTVTTIHEDRDAMVDAEATPTPDGLAVSWTRFPRALGTATVGVRIAYRTTWRMDRGRLKADTVALNPWAGALDSYFHQRKAGNVAAARALLAAPELRDALAPLAEELTGAEGGDLARGEGWVDFGNGCRVVVRRGARGVWRVAEVRDATIP
ncbi:MAG TPA: hypothetical protein VFQ39_15700 [Longimicrobium sp.]|nr:hypothetical protein [Longimicrobium sp.]